MRRFTMYRRDMAAAKAPHDANQMNAPDQPQFEGVVFTDGRVAVRWMTAKKSTAAWDSMADMLAIHGHPEYGSELVWHDGPDQERQILEAAVDRMGWPEIRAYQTELRKGQDIYEDAGGFFMRALRRLFGLPNPYSEVVTYQDAARAMIARQAPGDAEGRG